MGTITLTLPIAGQKIQAGLHASNYASLQTLLNGGIDGSNLDDMGATSGQALVWNGTSWAPAAVAGVPTGAIFWTGAAAAPSGYILGEGQSLLRAGTYAALFAEYGTIHGAVDGTHFNVPDLKERVIVHKHSSGLFATLGAKVGAQTHALSTGELAVHAHGDGTLTAATHNHGGGNHTHSQHASTVYYVGGHGFGGSADWDVVPGTQTEGSGVIIGSEAPDVTGSTSNAGSGTAHNNVQQSIVLNGIIKI